PPPRGLRYSSLRATPPQATPAPAPRRRGRGDTRSHVSWFLSPLAAGRIDGLLKYLTLVNICVVGNHYPISTVRYYSRIPKGLCPTAAFYRPSAPKVYRKSTEAFRELWPRGRR